MRARAASAALVVALLAGCQASGGNPQPSPTRASTSGPVSASPSVSPSSGLVALRRPIIQCRSRLSSMPPGRQPMWRWPMLAGSWRRERPAGRPSVNQAARCGCSALRNAEPAMCCVRCGPAATCSASCRQTLWTPESGCSRLAGAIRCGTRSAIRFELVPRDRYPRSPHLLPSATSCSAAGSATVTVPTRVRR